MQVHDHLRICPFDYRRPLHLSHIYILWLPRVIHRANFIVLLLVLGCFFSKLVSDPLLLLQLFSHQSICFFHLFRDFCVNRLEIKLILHNIDLNSRNITWALRAHREAPLDISIDLGSLLKPAEWAVWLNLGSLLATRCQDSFRLILLQSRLMSQERFNSTVLMVRKDKLTYCVESLPGLPLLFSPFLIPEPPLIDKSSKTSDGVEFKTLLKPVSTPLYLSLHQGSSPEVIGSWFSWSSTFIVFLSIL